MNGWTALHQQILGSSVWSTPYHVRILWISMLAMTDRKGIVRSSIPGLARMANITREEVEEGLRILSSPDPDTQTQEDDGRRIRKVEQGWLVINHSKYRATAQAELRKEQARLGMEKLRIERQAAQEATGVAPDPSKSLPEAAGAQGEGNSAPVELAEGAAPEKIAPTSRGGGGVRFSVAPTEEEYLAFARDQYPEIPPQEVSKLWAYYMKIARPPEEDPNGEIRWVTSKGSRIGDWRRTLQDKRVQRQSNPAPELIIKPQNT